MRDMKYFLTLAVASVIFLSDARAEEFDYRSYGQWLDSNLETEFHYDARRDSFQFYHSRTTRVTPTQVFLNATFRGRVLGHTWGDTVERQSGTVALTFENENGPMRFHADFEGIPGLIDIVDGRMRSEWVLIHINTLHGGGTQNAFGERWELDGYEYANSGMTFLHGNFHRRGEIVAGTVDHYDWSEGWNGFTGVFEAEK